MFAHGAVRECPSELSLDALTSTGGCCRSSAHHLAAGFLESDIAAEYKKSNGTNRSGQRND